jgi:4-hydroxy-2-oxoheptanedioate aldolase
MEPWNSIMIVRWVDRDRLQNGLLIGTFLNLGFHLSAELAASKGFDWLLFDTEHGAGDYGKLMGQLQAAAGFPCCPVVRVVANDPNPIKRVLDAGAGGVMVPFVNTAAEATRAATSVRYPPDGIRGVAGTTRATGFGSRQREYRDEANRNVLTVVQLETPEAVQNARAIAAVPGVDALFVGPLDLSFNLGCPADFDDAAFRTACQTVVSACREAGKAAGILVGPDRLQQAKDDGFRLIAVGSDGGCLNLGFDIVCQKIRQLR